MRKLFLYIPLLLFGINSKAQEQDISPAGVMISHAHPKGGWMVNYSYMHMEMGDNYNGTTKISDSDIFNSYLMAGSKMKMDMHMLMAMYGVSGRFTVMAMTNYISNSMSMNMYPGASHIHNHTGSDNSQPQGTMEMNTSGLGDSKVIGIYKILNGENSSLVGSLGLNIPTGNYKISTSPVGGVSSGRYPYMMQTGTGSVDFSPGLTYFSSVKKISWSTQVIATIRPFENSIGYHYGHEIMLNCWGGYRIKSFASTSLRMEAITAGEMTGSDPTLDVSSEPSADWRNYGGQKINTYLGFNFYLNKGFLKESKFALEYGLPVYQNYNGIQQGLTGTFLGSYTLSF